MSDFTYTPDYMFDESPEWHTLISQFENGYEQRRNKWSAPIRKWRLLFKNRVTSEFEAVRDFFNGKLGAYTQFTWTNPNDSVEYNVRFDGDTMTFTNKTYGLYDYEIKFIEVR
jgi:phage-related protein